MKSIPIFILLSLPAAVALAQNPSAMGPGRTPVPVDLSPVPASSVAMASPSEAIGAAPVAPEAAPATHPLREVVMMTWGNASPGVISPRYRLSDEERQKMREQLRSRSVFDTPSASAAR